MIELRHLAVGYPDRPVLHDVSLTLPDGALTAVLGVNGSGKSTLLKALCGILPIQGGQALLDGVPLDGFPPNMLARKVAYLAQSRQIPDITVRRMVLHGRFPYLSYPRRYRQEDLAAAEQAMAQMGLTELADEPLQKLSGGQRQKVYIAMALAQNAPTILLDEPTTYLDIGQQLRMVAELRKLRERGKAIALVLHDLPLALRTANQVVVLGEGRVLAAGTPQAVFESRCLDELFGVRLRRVCIPEGTFYFCGEA